MTHFDPVKLRRDFPLIHESSEAGSTIYLDNAATTHKPEAVLNAVSRFYRQQNANVHRAAHKLGAIATIEFENARETTRSFLNAKDKAEIIWTRGTTESINLVANCIDFKPLDEILISALEHHANIVPWQLAAKRSGACIKVIPVNSNGDIDIDAFHRLLSKRTRLVSITQASNAIGTIPPILQIIESAHNAGALVLVDGAQGLPHQEVDLQTINCDFYACSGHKAFAPTGIGILYGKLHLLNEMPPWQGGGEMITKVTFSESDFQLPPYRFEAGTPNIAGAIGFAAALSYLKNLDRAALHNHEQKLLAHAKSRCQSINGLRIIGHPQHQAPLLSFTSTTMNNKDVATLLDQQGIAVRVGHHCAMPLMNVLGVKGTIRASFSIYNTLSEIDQFADALESILNTNLLITAPENTLTTEYDSEEKELADNIASITKDFSAFGREITPEKICDQLLKFRDWQQRYRQIIKLGEKLPKFPNALKNESNQVTGCESAVWLHCYREEGVNRLCFLADSDSHILRGLLYIILACANHLPPSSLATFDPTELFKKLGLDRHLSPSRSNGLHSIIEEIRKKAVLLDN